MLRVFLSLLLIVPLSSCGPLGRAISKIGPEEEPEENGGIPDSMLPGSREGEAVTPTESHAVGIGQDPAKVSGIMGLPSEADILFLDPDDVEASEEALAGLGSLQKRDWLLSHSIARNYSMVEGKPLLILFTDSPSPSSGGSPAAARLEQELFARTDFTEWASESFVRLKLDFNVKDRRSADSKKQSEAIRKEQFLLSLKKRYRVSGFPVIVVLAADGTEVQRVRGYQSGNSEFTWGLLRTAEVAAREQQEKFEASLEKKGYRRWTGKNDQRILARLVSYKDGDLLLIGPNGERHKTKEENLSSDDRKWLNEAKEKSEVRRKR